MTPLRATGFVVAIIVALAVADTVLRGKKPANVAEAVTGNTYTVSPFTQNLRGSSNPLMSAYGYGIPDSYEPTVHGFPEMN